jgi:hypothetical protein
MDPMSNYGPPSRPGRNPLFPFDPTAPDSDMYMPPSKSARRIMLAQQAREKYLLQARRLVMIVGAVTIVGNIILFATAGMRARVISPSQHEIETLIVGARLAYALSAVIGLALVGLAFWVYTRPVRATVIGLLLYIAGNVLSFLLNPANLVVAVLIEIFLVPVLAKAVHSALAAERERAAEEQYAAGVVI